MAALYNRYRPRTFAEVRGQEHATDALIQALRGGKVHHAYLFSGPRGCGKTSSARILAASLNCEHGPTPEPCGTCDHCVAIRTGTSLDVIEIDAASHGGVDDTRDLRDRAFYAPASARFKVYIVDEAHMITKDAFNALLKIVEEPPPHVKFVFATTEPDKVIATIRSRTFHYHFRLVPPRVLIEHLQSICTAEDATVDPAVLPLVVRAGGGSVRDSLSVLDQLLAGTGPAGLTYEAAVQLLGVTDAVLLDSAVDALAARDGSALFGVVERVTSSGHDPRRFAGDLLERMRDLVVLSAVDDADERGLLETIPPDQVDRMRQQARRLGPAELSRAADLLHAGLVEMRGTMNPRLLLELVCARILLPGSAHDGGALAVRLDRVERRLDTGVGPSLGTAPILTAPSAPTAQPAPSSQEKPQSSSPPSGAASSSASAPTEPSAAWPKTASHTDETPGAAEAATGAAEPRSAPALGTGTPELERVRALWPQILDATRRKPSTHALLTQYGELVDVDARAMTVAFQLPAIARQFSNGVNVEKLQEAITQVLGAPLEVVVIVGASGAGAQPPAPSGEGRPASTPPPMEAEGTADDDEVIESAPRGEDAAVALLQSGLGATVIGEVAGP